MSLNFWRARLHVPVVVSINVSRIMDKHLKSLAPMHIDTKFIKLDAEVSTNHSIEMILEFS